MKALDQIKKEVLIEIEELEARRSKIALSPVEDFEVQPTPFKQIATSAEENQQNIIDSLNSQIVSLKVVFAETVLYGETDNLGIG